MDVDKASIEELRAEVVRLTEVNNDIKERYQNISDIVAEKDNQIKKQAQSITDLKLKNYDLFTKIPTMENKINNEVAEEPRATITLNEVINDLTSNI